MNNAVKHLLQKLLDGQCSKEELMGIQLLLKDEENRKILDDLLCERETQAWDNAQENNRLKEEQIRTKLEEMHFLINTYENRHRSFFARFGKWNKTLRYAAVWIGILLVAGTVIWQFTKNDMPLIAGVYYKEITNPIGIPSHCMLPDSTIVYLAGGSTLKYKESFFKTDRNVQLSGEAFFEVKRDTVHPFTIHSENLETRVLGTSFKIIAFEGQGQEVAVATGKVSVSSVLNKGKAAQLALLTPGLKAIYNPITNKITKGEVDISSLQQWKNGILFFDEQPMKLVAKQLEGCYGIKFVFADTDMSNSLVSGTFSASEPVSDILDMLGFVGKFRYEKKNEKTYTIYKRE